MNYRILAVMLTLGVFPWLTPWPVASQPATTQDGDVGTPPRTPWGHPDLQGVWNFTLNTPLERPAEFGVRAVLTEEEGAVRAQADAQLRSKQNNPAPVAEVGSSGRPRTIYDDGQGGTSSRAYNRFWVDLRRTSLQTSLVVDPPDGRIPPLTAEAEQWHAEQQIIRRGVSTDAPTPGGFVEDLGPRGLFTRCLLGFNSGPPMVPSTYNNNVMILQSPGQVVLLNEMVHETRVIPLDGRPHIASDIRQWMGDSRGRWEGDTLVVTTTNFTDHVFDPSDGPGGRDRDEADAALRPEERLEIIGGRMRPRGVGLTLVERLTRTAADTLLYQFTMNDPGWYRAPWTVQFPMARSDEPMHEYACHEGNYAMVNILAGAAEPPATSESR